MWKSIIGRFQHFVTYQLVKNLLKAVHEDEILQVRGRHIYLGSRRLSEEEIVALRSEAREFKNTYLWRMMRRDIQFMAYLRSQAKARTDEDLIYGSAMYYNLELLEKFIAKCEAL